MSAPVRTTSELTLASAAGRGTLAATVLGSGMAFLDGSIANIATRQIGRQFDASFASLQWVIVGYTLTLASLILLGGSLGDRYGRKRIYLVGMVWFAVASIGCAIAPNIAVLVVARVVQGIGGALLTPGSLAIIQASFTPEDAPRAVGLWSGMTSVASASGPLLGGWLVQHVSWRAAFAINVPLGVLALVVAWRFIPETKRPRTECARLDTWGVALVSTSLALLTWGPTMAGSHGWSAAAAAVTAAGVAMMGAFVAVERVRRDPLMPTSLFADRTFSGANLMTFTTYGAMSVVFFLLVLHLQVTAGYGAFRAGIATLPVVLALVVLSPLAGRVAARIGPRWPMTLGPLFAAVGIIMLTGIDEHHASYLTNVLPGVITFSIGIGTFVAPLTSTVMSAAPATEVGIASGVNNAVARSAGLLAIAVVPPAVGLVGTRYLSAAVMTHGFRLAMVVCSVTLVVGAVIVLLTVRSRPHASRVP